MQKSGPKHFGSKNVLGGKIVGEKKMSVLLNWGAKEVKSKNSKLILGRKKICVQQIFVLEKYGVSKNGP